MPFDENLRPDVESVLRATALLDITEYELFHLAYLRWHGERAEERSMEPYFVAYMFGEVVPPWVRDYARMVERMDRNGHLDRRALGALRLEATRQMVSRGMRYGVIIGLTVVSLIVLVEFMAQFIPMADRCMFPPCY